MALPDGHPWIGCRETSGLEPGGLSLHGMMVAHGPDNTSRERAMNAPRKLDGTMAIMFETRQVLRPPLAALSIP